MTMLAPSLNDPGYRSPTEERSPRPTPSGRSPIGNDAWSAADDRETRAIEANEEFHATVLERLERPGELVDVTDVFPDL